MLETFDLRSRVISVGNITTGGTGKTPLVAHIASLLAERGETVCILSRGYGRKNPKKRVLVSDGKTVLAEPHLAGDEPFELARKLLGTAIVIADSDRVAATDWAKRKFGVTTFLLDDGFQHRRAGRDVDIVCIDASNPFGGDKMLPAGRLREPQHNLARADIVVITRSDLVDDISHLKSQISNLNPAAPIFVSQNEIVSVTNLEEFHAKLQEKQSDVIGSENDNEWIALQIVGASRVAAFCALGNPESFFLQVSKAFEVNKTAGLELAATKPFRDHHIYTQPEIDGLEKFANETGVDAFVTTAKDAVKLSGLKFTIPCFVVEIKVRLDNEEFFASLL